MPSANKSAQNDGTHTTETGHALGTQDLPRVVTPLPPTGLPVLGNWREANDQILAAFIQAVLISLPESTDITFVSFNSMRPECGATFHTISGMW